MPLEVNCFWKTLPNGLEMILNRTAKEVRSVVINGGVLLLEGKGMDNGK